MERRSKVCVTGASGFLASSLVKELLKKGHVVHATLRNLEDKSKTQLLKSFPGADTRLHLFEADLYDPLTFEAAIQGCEFVCLLATPLQHNANSQCKDTTQASVAAVRSILQSCERSGTVKRVIYTGSVTAASPLKEDGTGFKDFIDESCWTPLNLAFAHCEDFEKSYICSKTESEKEVLSYNYKGEGNKEFEVVSLACALVGGDTVLPAVPLSVRCTISPLTGEKVHHRQMKFLQALLGSVPLVHIQDVCEAHIFCMEKPSMAGRFLLASAYPTMHEIVDYYTKNYPELKVIKEVEGDGHGIGCTSTKLADVGFKCRYDVKQILDDSVDSAKRLGLLEEQA